MYCFRQRRKPTSPFRRQTPVPLAHVKTATLLSKGVAALTACLIDRHALRQRGGGLRPWRSKDPKIYISIYFYRKPAKGNRLSPSSATTATAARHQERHLAV